MKTQRKTFATLGPRERLLEFGAQALNDAELLAILLRTGTLQLHVVEFAQQLLNTYGGLRELLHASADSLMSQPGIGQAKASEILAVSELSKRSLEQKLKQGPTFNQTHVVKRYCIAHLGHLDIEHCMAIFLNTQLQLIVTQEIARGTLNQAFVYPREVVKAALQYHAAAVILAHNHPSGAREPSAADISLTKHLRKALALVDIKLIDHVIVAGHYACSMAEEGLI